MDAPLIDMTRRQKRITIITTIATCAIAALLGLAPEFVAPFVDAILRAFGITP